MKKKTAQQFIQLNRLFYETVAEEFNLTRNASWYGFEKVWETIFPTLTLSPNILDIGCGNGRFGSFLKTKIGNNFNYTGIDQNQYLLNQAYRSLKGLAGIELSLHNIFTPDNPIHLPIAHYHAITLLGVMHHIPGFDSRQKLLTYFGQYLANQGFLIISLWQFFDDPRERNKIIPWGKLNIEIEDLEKNDFLLDWQNKGIPRYCHFVDRQEVSKLMSQIPYKLVADFLADGKSGKLNRYLIWKKV